MALSMAAALAAEQPKAEPDTSKTDVLFAQRLLLLTNNQAMQIEMQRRDAQLALDRALDARAKKLGCEIDATTVECKPATAKK